MKNTTLLLSLFAASAASLVWAHGSATGIVKERMDGMVVMSKATKAITTLKPSETTRARSRNMPVKQ